MLRLINGVFSAKIMEGACHLVTTNMFFHSSPAQTNVQNMAPKLNEIYARTLFSNVRKHLLEDWPISYYTKKHWPTVYGTIPVRHSAYSKAPVHLHLTAVGCAKYPSLHSTVPSSLMTPFDIRCSVHFGTVIKRLLLWFYYLHDLHRWIRR